MSQWAIKTASSRSAWALLAVLGATLASGACYPGEISSLSETDVVVTVSDPGFDFDRVSSYVLVDSVIHFSDILGDSLDLIELPRSFDDDILARVTQKLQGLGWSEEENPEQDAPDLVALVGVVAVERSGAWVSYPWYWWGWYPGWDYWCPGCWGPGWGWYPPVGGTYSWEEGTLTIALVDPDELEVGEQRLPAVWLAAANGVLPSSGSGDGSRVLRAIDQAFEQSPYLGG